MSAKDQDVLQLLDSLDDIPVAKSKAPVSNVQPGTGTPRPGTPSASRNNGDPNEALAFLDELAQQSSRPTRVLTPGPRVRNATVDSVRRSVDSTRKSANSSPVPQATAPVPAAQGTPPSSSGAGGWGWGSVWTTASAVVAQARTVVDEGVKQLPNEQAKKLSQGVLEYVKNTQLDKIGNDLRVAGLSTLSEIINAVAPPIAEHEVIQVWLSHDMIGYDGVESLVYRAMARIMEQVEGGDLVVNRGNEIRSKGEKDAPEERDLGAVEGLEAAIKLAAADIESLLKSDRLTAKAEEQSRADKHGNPTTYSTVLLRIQPFLSSPFASTTDANDSPQQLQFLLHLVDPSHSITHLTTTQAIPAAWLEIWDQYDWVEDLVVDTLRVGVEVLGEQYLVSRMGWGKPATPPVETVPAS